jgi:hypothetical protein
VRLLALVFPGVDIPFLARLAPWMPFAVRLHLAVSLIGLLSLGVYLSPATLWFFGVNELLGHLPVYAAMLVLLVYGSDPELRARVPALWPWRRREDPHRLRAG